MTVFFSPVFSFKLNLDRVVGLPFSVQIVFIDLASFLYENRGRLFSCPFPLTGGETLFGARILPLLSQSPLFSGTSGPPGPSLSTPRRCSIPFFPSSSLFFSSKRNPCSALMRRRLLCLSFLILLHHQVQAPPFLSIDLVKVAIFSFPLELFPFAWRPFPLFR